LSDIAIGRKEIMAALHVSDWKTVKRWKKNGLPLRHLPNRKPMILISELKLWMITYDEMKKNTPPMPT